MSIELDRLLTEIDEQPAVVQRLLERQLGAVRSIATTIRARDPSAMVLVARGSSDNAAVYGRYLFEVCNRRLTSLAAPSGLTLYGRGDIMPSWFQPMFVPLLFILLGLYLLVERRAS